MPGPSELEIRPYYEAADFAELPPPERLGAPRDGERDGGIMAVQTRSARQSCPGTTGVFMAKNTARLWYDRDAKAAARFYASTFPGRVVSAGRVAPGNYPNCQQGVVLMVGFTVPGIPCLGLNGGPRFKHSGAFSFGMVTNDQAERDR